MSLRKAGEAGEAGEAGGEKSIFYDFALREYIYVFVSPSTPRFPCSPSLPQQIKLNLVPFLIEVNSWISKFICNQPSNMVARLVTYPLNRFFNKDFTFTFCTI